MRFCPTTMFSILALSCATGDGERTIDSGITTGAVPPASTAAPSNGVAGAGGTKTSDQPDSAMYGETGIGAGKTVPIDGSGFEAGVWGGIGQTGGQATGTGGTVRGTSGTGGATSGGGITAGKGGATSGSGGATSGSGKGGAPGGKGGATGGRGGASNGSGGAGSGRGGATQASDSGSNPSGKLTFVGDFETGDLSQWPYVERCQNDRILVYSAANAPAGAPAPRQGTYAARFHVLDSDVAPCTSTENPRAELETQESLMKPGDEVWQAWSIYLPSPLPTPKSTNGWLVTQDDYGAPWDGSASIEWTLNLGSNPPRFGLDRGDQYGHDQPTTGQMPLGRWVDFLVHIRLSNKDDGSGFLEAWVDGNPLSFTPCNCTKLVMQTMHSTQSQVGFYLTSYRAAGFLDSLDTYYDGVRVGTSRDAVELQ